MRAFALALAALLAFAPPIRAAEPVKIALTDFAPLLIAEPTTPGEDGFVTEVIRAALTRAGLTPEFTYVPLARAVTEAREGTYQATISAVNSGERAEWFLFSDPITSVSVAAFTDAGFAGEINSYADLAKATGRVVAIRGYAFLPALKAAEVKFTEINGMDSGVNLVTRADPPTIFVNFAEATAFYLEKKGVAAGSVKRFTLSRSGYYLAVSKKAADPAGLTAKFNDGLKAVRADGTYDKLLAKYPSITAK
jgi:polar amino acid transport system substrate-binding protein